MKKRKGTPKDIKLERWEYPCGRWEEFSFDTSHDRPLEQYRRVVIFSNGRWEHPECRVCPHRFSVPNKAHTNDEIYCCIASFTGIKKYKAVADRR